MFPRKSIVVILTLIACFACQNYDETVRIELTKEKIRLKLKNNQILIGNRKLVQIKKDYSIDTRVVYEFLGIPFGKAPVNERRFQFPQRLDRLITQDEYDATFFRPSCMQEYDLTFSNFRGSEMWNPAHNVSEDCLYFNIWVPVTSEQDSQVYRQNRLFSYLPNVTRKLNEKLSSLFWIYGGSFSSGSANLNITHGTILSSFENVIVVTSNYRIGPFGFLYLNSSTAPGNAGLADQVLAIEWYKENYADLFGASQENICLFGESAGSMSVHNLLLTYKANIFNRAILQSLSSYLDISFRRSEDALRVSLDFAEKVGCIKINENQNPKDSASALTLEQIKTSENLSEEDFVKLQNDIYKCLLKQNSSYLSQKQFEVEYVNQHLKMQFLPTMDYHKLLQKDPLDYNFNDYLEKFNSHELLIGVNYDESTYFSFYYYYDVYFNLNSFLKPTLKYDNDFVYQRLLESLKTKQVTDYKLSSVNYDDITTVNISKLTVSNDRVDDHFYKNFVNCLSNLYTYKYKKFVDSFEEEINLDLDQEDKNSPKLAWKKFNKIVGDYIYNCPTIQLANKFNENNYNKTYFYRFSKRSKHNPWPEWLGVLHGYEIEYVFGYPWIDKNVFERDDRMMSQKMMNYWANFAKYGRLTSSYDKKRNRKYFVEFTTLAKYDNASEQDELDWFNSAYPVCDLLNNQMSPRDSYARKYEQCLNFQSEKVLNTLINSSRSKYTIFSQSNLFVFVLFCILIIIM